MKLASEKKRKKNKKSEESIWELWKIKQRINMCIMGVPEREVRNEQKTYLKKL